MSPIAAAKKSTNVRIHDRDGAGDGPRPLAAALGVWAGCVALAAYDGVFARLGAEVDIALAVFAVTFAAASYALDASVRAIVDRMPFARLAAIALAGDAAIAIAVAERPAEMAQGVSALLAFFAAPLALAAHVPAAVALARRFRRAPARSPGASPAAT